MVLVLLGCIVVVVTVTVVLNLIWRRQFLSEAEKGELTEEELDEVTGANTELQMRSSGFGRGTLWSWRRVPKRVPPESD